MDLRLLIPTLVLYIVATAAYVSHLLLSREGLRRLGAWSLGAAFAVETLAIVVRLLTGGYAGVGSYYETLLAGLAWLVVGAYLLLQQRYRYQLTVLGAFISPLAFLFTLSAFAIAAGGGAVSPAVRRAWLPVHIVPAAMGYAILALAFCVSLAYLIQEKQLKSKGRSGLFRRLPSLETLDQLNHRFVTWGFSLFTLVFLTGAILAKAAWGAFWSWEPVQVWSAVTWTLYALLLHSRLSGLRGRRAAALTILGFAVLLVTFFSLSLVFPGKHGVRLG